MSLGGRDDLSPAISAYRTPTPAPGARNRYAEIMSQYGQAQPFSFFGYPQGYTGGFTPYQRIFDPKAAAATAAAAAAAAQNISTVPRSGGSGGGTNREGPSAWSQMTPEERAAYYAANPTEAKFALGAQDLFGNMSLMGMLSKYTNPDAFYNSRLEKLGLNPESFAYGPPDPNFSSQAAAAARQEAAQAAITAANADTGFVANPMAQDPSQRVVSAPVITAPIVEAPVPVVTAPIVEAPAPAPEPVQMVNVTETYNGDMGDPGPGWTQVNLGRGEVRYTRQVSVPANSGTATSWMGGGGGGGGGYTVGGYAPGSPEAARAASGLFGMGPGTPGFNAGFAKGGHVSMQHLQGPNPMGLDDGYAALKDGEYVINDKAVKKYGIELMNAINSGKISKGKLRGLLEM